MRQSFLKLMMNFFTIIAILIGIFSTTVYAATEFKAGALWPQITQSGRYFNLPVGIARDKAGLFYITDKGSHQVKVLTAQGELLRTWGGFGTAPGQFNDPFGIKVTESGEVLVVDSGNSRIQVFNSDGKFIRQWGSLGSSNGQMDHPTFLTLDKQQKVYVSDTANHRVQVYTVDGQWLSTIGGQILENPLGIEFNSTGELYITEGIRKEISVFDSAGQYLRSFGAAQLKEPLGLVFDAQDQLYVTDFGNHSIQVFDNNEKFIRTWSTFAYTKAGLNGAFDLEIDPASNTVYVADTSNNRIQHFSLQGEYKGAWQSQGSELGEFTGANISISPQGEIFVADELNNRIQIFTQDGEWKAGFGEVGSGTGQLTSPTSIAFDQQNRIYVADFGNDRIQVFDAQGKYLTQWETSEPSHLFISHDNLLYVTDSFNHQVKVFTLDGTWVRGWGSKGSAPGQFNKPDGIVVDDNGSVYVTDRRNHRIQVFDNNGTFILQWGKLGSDDGEFNIPADLSLSPNGLLYVADAWNNRIQVFQTDGSFVESIGEAGTQPGQFGQPYTVAMADDDTLVVGEFANNRVQVLRRDSTGTSTNSAYKAIILAGGGSSTESYHNALWDSTQLLSNNAYFALRAQGFGKDSIKYLSSGNLQNDLDGNGKFDDLEAASLANLAQAILQWATDADDVLIYLIDHGGPGTFKINQQEVLSREQLSQALTLLQNQVKGKITVIIEACQSASFFTGVGGQNRFLIASADQQQPAVISNQGMNSFSYHFWYAIHTGQSLQQAFERARQGMSQQEIIVNNQVQRQNAQLDADGNGVFDKNDYSVLAGYCLGSCLQLASDEPQLIPVTSSTTLVGETNYALATQVSSLAPISRAWAIINRPDSNHTDLNQPVSNLPEVELQCTEQSGGQYLCQGEYREFDVNGVYSITFHARDQQARTSVPQAVIAVEQTAGSLQSQNSVSTYNDLSRTLQINDVQYGSKHYQAELTHPAGDFTFSIKAVQELNAQSVQQPEQLNPDSLELTLNKVSAFGRFYKVVLKHLGNFVFQLRTAEEVP